MPTLHFSHKTQLSLTPSLKEAISLLQLSSVELIEKINDFCYTNPFIEKKWPHYSCTDWSHIFLADPSTQSLAFYMKTSLVHYKASKNVFEAGVRMIDNMDDSGFFDPTEFSRLPLDVQESLDLWLSQIEPVGLGARNLSQCLQWQLLYRDDLKQQSHTQELLHLLQLGSHPEKLLCELRSKKMHPGIKALFHQLDFRPSHKWSYSVNDHSLTDYTVDLIVSEHNNAYEVELNPHIIPHLQIIDWPEELSKKDRFRTLYQQALLFKKMISTRHATLLKTAKYIVDYQNNFFKQGVHALKPLILSKIAQDLELHESTISRILKHKTIMTPFGVIELKKLLSRPIKKTTDGQDEEHTLSRTAILELLKKCIFHENPQSPYSDQELSDILKKQGFCVARRTIAKYREQLHITNSLYRRQ